MTPCQVDSAGLSLARRLRLYWMTWELEDEPGLIKEAPRHTGLQQISPVTFQLLSSPRITWNQGGLSLRATTCHLHYSAPFYYSW